MANRRSLRSALFFLAALASQALFAGEATPPGQRSDLRPIAEKSLTNPHDLFFVRRERTTTAVIDRAATYDYQTSPLRKPDGTKDVYYCSGSGGHDYVYRATLSSSNVLLDGPEPIIAPTLGVGGALVNGVPDGLHACDVSVVEHGYPGVAWPGGEIDSPGEELLYLYYECGPVVTARGSNPVTPRQTGGPAEICLAASADNGATWMKHSTALEPTTNFGTSTTVPTAVVEKNPIVTNEICGWADGESPFFGHYVVDLSPVNTNPATYPLCDNIFLAYGSGHPSAISMPKAGSAQREIWLYYYDSRGNWGNRGLTLVKSDDGIHFGEPIDLWAIDPETGEIVLDGNDNPLRLPGGKVRYYDVDVAGHDGVFIATDAFFVNYFHYSFDGIHWIAAWTANGFPDPDLRLGEVRSDPADPGADLCVSPGAQGVLADEYGWVDSLTNVEFFVGEGNLADASGFPVNCYHSSEETLARGYTWALYSMKGDFGELIRPEVANACAHFDGMNVRSQQQRGETGSTTENTIWWVKDGKRYHYANWADFLAKNGNDPYAYLDVSTDTFDRVDLECTNGGLRPAPAVAVADSATVAKDMAVRISVLANDGGSINAATVAQAAAPAHGSLSISGTGVVTYTHNGDGATSDSFTYKVKDTTGFYSNAATVTVTIATPSVLHRVNAGGPAIATGGWAEDRTWSSGGIPSSRSNAAAMGDSTFAVGASIDTSLVPGIPAALFQDERFDPSGGAPEMSWSFPVNSGQMVEARLYFAENYESSAGGRVFSMNAEGSACASIQSLDIYAAAGNAQNKGIMRSCKTFVTDGKLDLSFVTIVNGPTVHGIEILGLPLADVPPVAVADSAITAKGLGVAIPVLANDTHDSSPGVTLDAGSVTIVNPPARGTASVSAGVITYLHTAGDLTADRFGYTVTDSNGVLSNTGVVTITVKAKTLLYRINAGGAGQTQTGGNWSADTSASPSAYVNTGTSGNTVYSAGGTITADGTVPAGTNTAIFNSLRFDLTTGANMIWSLPISIGAGPQVETKLYFAEIYHSAANQRKFGVKIEGGTVLNEFDIYAAAGAQGTMRSFQKSTDGTLNIEFVPGSLDAPQVNGIEVWGPVP